MYLVALKATNGGRDKLALSANIHPSWVANNKFVIYDESGRIAAPENDPEWNDGDMKLARECTGRVTPIMNSYYRCDY